jgi:hypothetical protein
MGGDILKEKITVVILSLFAIFAFVRIIHDGIMAYKHIRLNKPIVLEDYPKEVQYGYYNYDQTSHLVDGYVLYYSPPFIISPAVECMTDPKGEGYCFGSQVSEYYLLVKGDEILEIKQAVRDGVVHGACLMEEIDRLNEEIKK